MDHRAVAAALAEVRRAGVRVQLIAGRVRLEAPVEPRAEPVQTLREHREVVIGLLEAERLLRDALPRLENAYRQAAEPKPEVNGPRWRGAEASLTEAFASGDPARARKAVEAYERRATELLSTTRIAAADGDGLAPPDADPQAGSTIVLDRRG